ncbi:MAG: ABC transporter permease [bacterium]
MFEYLSNNFFEISKLFLQHLFLVMLSLVIALVISLPSGYLLSGNKRVESFIIPFFGIIYTIPSLALFAIFIPLMGLGLKSAILALVLYNLFILLKNTVAAFNTIESSIIESAKGMGLNSIQLFWDIELPYALPGIIGGVRIASISTIGIATVAAWINAGGLGVLIFDGLYKNYLPEIIIGSILISAMAILLNNYFFYLENIAFKFINGKS